MRLKKGLHHEADMTRFFLSVSSGFGSGDGVQRYGHSYGGLRIFNGSLELNGSRVSQGEVHVFAKGTGLKLSEQQRRNGFGLI